MSPTKITDRQCSECGMWIRIHPDRDDDREWRVEHGGDYMGHTIQAAERVLEKEGKRWDKDVWQ